MTHLHIIVIIIFSAGIFGGIINFLLNFNDEKSRKIFKIIDQELLKSITMGIGASFLVPLFLKMISSNIIKESIEDNYALLTFGGFCLIASMFSSAFIKSVSEKIINELNEKVNKIEKEVVPIVEKETEAETTISEDEIETSNQKDQDEEKVKKDILNSIAFGKYTYRTINGIATELGLSRKNVARLINELVKLELLEQGGGLNSKTPTKFYITPKGRKSLNESK